MARRVHRRQQPRLEVADWARPAAGQSPHGCTVAHRPPALCALRIGIGVGDQVERPGAGSPYLLCTRRAGRIDTPVLVAFCARSPHGVSAGGSRLVGVVFAELLGGRAFEYRAVERRPYRRAGGSTRGSVTWCVRPPAPGGDHRVLIERRSGYSCMALNKTLRRPAGERTG